MSAKRITLANSATRTTSSNADPIDLKNVSMLAVILDITAVATVTDFTAFLQGSDDGGTTWADVVADHIAKHSGGQSPGATGTNDRDICDGETAVSKHYALYKHLPFDKVRLAWYFSGTSVTFNCGAVGK